MTKTDFQALLSEIQCDDYHFHIGEKDGALFLQGDYNEPDAYSGDPAIQKTRKWILSEHMTPSEFVQTVFKAVMTSYEHRVRESFLFRGRRVFGPHFDVFELWKIAESTDVRKAS